MSQPNNDVFTNVESEHAMMHFSIWNVILYSWLFWTWL